MAHLDLAKFKANSVMPNDDIDALDASQPGFLASQFVAVQGRVMARLRKRYGDFADPVPAIVLEWEARIITPRAYDKRGWNPSDEQSQRIIEDGKQAWIEVGEAADGNVGLYDLPLRADTTDTGIVKGGPLSYAEASPYSWTDAQVEALAGGGR